MPFDIHVDAQGLAKTECGSYSGLLYFRTSVGGIPHSRWSDFAITVLARWATELCAYLNEDTNAATLEFMSGPFSMVCNRVDDETILASYYQEGESGRLMHEEEVTTRDVVDSVIYASDLVLQHCKLRNINIPEVGELGVSLRNLRKRAG
ncbi:MAG: hypothetical protein HUU29_04750 [Planctomycetaceae bacterium]|nr:hypothetical protein [Planctomycetaceae bacterium]